MAKAEATVEEFVSMIERCETLPHSRQPRLREEGLRHPRQTGCGFRTLMNDIHTARRIHELPIDVSEVTAA